MRTQSCIATYLFAGGIALFASSDAVAAYIDPFDSSTGDRLELCQDKIAHSFRYDFNHVETPAAEQAVEAFHLYCRDEIAAMRALVPNWSVPRRDGESIGDEVDDSALAHFSNAQNDILETEHPGPQAPPPGGNVLTNNMRWSVFSHPSPISPDEVAYVYRRDAFGWDPDVSFHGAIDNWTYRYGPNPGSGVPQRWDAVLEQPDTEVWIACDSLGPPERACSLTFTMRTFPQHGYLSLRAGGIPFAIRGVCNPGGTGLVVDAPQPDTIDARHGSLTIDDEGPIPLPDGSGCATDKDGSFASRVLSARRFRSSYAPPFRERVIDNDGPANALRPALTLAQQTYEATRGAIGRPRILADIAALSASASPFPIEDALLHTYDWSRARDCLAGQMAKIAFANELTLGAAMQNGVCRNQVADLDWRASKIGAPTNQSTDDKPLSIAGADSRIASARKALANEVLRKPDLNFGRLGSSATFSPNERPAMNIGHQGFTGVESGFDFGISPFAYGYFFAEGIAQGAVTGRFDRVDDIGRARRGFATTIIRCRTDAAPKCTVRIPFESDAGGLRIETDGGRTGAQVCAEAPLRNWNGWMLAAEYSTLGWKLGKDHCVGRKSGAVLSHFLNCSGVRLRAPGESKDVRTRLVYPSNFDLVLSLTNYLVSHMNKFHQ